jgi:MOSC domain-containing protein YiiM
MGRCLMQTIGELLHTVPQVGRLEWIEVSPKSRAPIELLTTVTATAGKGLDADCHAKGRPSKRQVTLIQHEHLLVIASISGRRDLTPQMLRRNFAERRFWVGGVLLEGTGPCAPCSRMEEALEPCGYNAMRGHGGITARVLQAGVVYVGDVVQREH